MLDKSKEWMLGQIRGFILDWYEKDIGGVDKKAIDLLRSIKLAGSEKGKAVAIGCPYSGAYSSDEQVAFISWYVDAYTEDQISLTDFAFIMALQSTGARPRQIRYLYCEDLNVSVKDGISSFNLNIPHAKKLKATFRASFQTKNDVNEDLYLVLNAQSQSAISFCERHFEIKLSESQKKTIPIFINKNEIEKLTTRPKAKQTLRINT